ncbi:MAG: TonB-dependent receptor plug domain-containing protein [Leptospiraceae bacterium]|nr:TonB-dependent receptor plug domain-containing protein [Leptospiraceae bacterium]
MKAFLIAIFIFLSVAILAQDTQNKSKTIYLTHFNPYKSQKSDAMANKIFSNLEESFKANGFEVKESKSDLKTTLAIAKGNGAKFVVDGYYKLNESEGVNIYSQIYNPDTGYMIDALNVTDELSGIEGVTLDPNETKKTADSSIDELKKKIAIRVRTNTKRTERRENINDAITSTALGKDKDLYFPIAEENVASASADVFKILAEKETVSVASNVIKDAKKQPASVSVITKEQIKMSGARTVNEVLTTYVPGFFTVEDQDDTIAGFRGFASDNNAKVLLLINGHNMNTEWFWGPPDSIINGMNMEYIERIEVIRGPGSVTLGQGALLGVINIITKNGNTTNGTTISGSMGQNNYSTGTLQAGGSGKENPDLKTFFQISTARYNGQEIRSEGWAKSQTLSGQEGYYDYQRGLTELVPTSKIPNDAVRMFDTYTPDPSGGFNSVVTRRNVATSGARLKRADSDVVTGVINYKNLELTGFYTNQTRDLYNFYRDRNKLQNTVKSGTSTYTYDISDKISLKFKNYYTVDDIFLRSQKGLALGGTREYRYGGSVILSLNELIKNNNAAIGVEYRKYDMGQVNSESNNYILNYSQNVADNALLLDTSGKSPNERNRYVYPGSISVKSFFMEDFYKLSDKVDIFGAFRYDKHPYWGSNLAPRIGALYGMTKDLRFRFSYQEGFRGVVGVSYAGGFEGDGHLRIQNFPYIQASNIPNSFDGQGFPTSYYRDVPKTKPEKMRSFEFATNYSFTSNLSLENIMFFNKVEKVIDVGVLYCDKPSTPTATTPGPNGCNMPRLGNDVPGNWNGYWFYKNNPGEIRQGGAEISINYKTRMISTTFSQSIVKLLTASPGQTDSVYLTSDQNNRQFRGYPSNVTRWHTLFYPVDKLTISVTYLYYPSWYSPKNQRVEGNHLANIGFNYKFLENMEFYFMIKNLFAAGNLYPMISNAGGPDLSNGTPAVEKRTFWGGFSYTF